jgi:hypothetical protein
MNTSIRERLRKMRPTKDQLYDQKGRMPKGKFEFMKFEDVPHEYLLWVRDTWNLTWYPNLERYVNDLHSEDEEAPW